MTRIDTEHQCYVIPEWALSLFDYHHGSHSAALQLMEHADGQKVLIKSAVEGEDWVNDLANTDFSDDKGNTLSAADWLASLELINYSYIQEELK